MTREELSKFAAERRVAWDSRDSAGLASGHTADGDVVSPIFGTVKGRAAIEASYRNLFAVFADWEFIGDDLIMDGDVVVEGFTARATHTHEFLGVPGTNRRFQIRGVLLFRFKDGLIAHEERVYDFSGMLIQIGVLKARPGKA
jgi:predicted ester cyclase